MTKENDALIAANAAAHTGCFAGFTNQGEHTSGSYHYRPGTPSGSGSVGLAVDFDAPFNSAADLLACARFFLGHASQLAELFHTPLGVWVKNGKTYPISQLDATDRAEHYNHVHVAVSKGVFLTPPNPPAPPVPSLPGSMSQPQTFGDDMQRTVITTPTLDASGNGYIDTQIAFDHVVNVLPFGPAPDRDGYAWPNWYWSANNTNGQARIEVEGATPRGQVSFAVWSVQ